MALEPLSIASIHLSWHVTAADMALYLEEQRN